MNRLYIGFDPSLNATGLVALNARTELIASTIVSSTKNKTLHERANEIVHGYKAWLNEIHGRFTGNWRMNVVYETFLGGYSKEAYSRGMIDYAVLQSGLYDSFRAVHPKHVKIFTAGKGNVGKDLMAVSAYKKWGIEFPDEKPALVNNLIDAYALARIAHAIEHPEGLSKVQLKIVEEVA